MPTAARIGSRLLIERYPIPKRRFQILRNILPFKGRLFSMSISLFRFIVSMIYFDII